MKLTSLLLVVLAPLGFAQESIGPEEGQKVARKLTETLGTPGDAPFAVDADVEKPQGLKANGAGVMVIPDRQLTADRLAHLEGTIVPVAELWMLKVSVATEGKPVASDRLRLVTISDNEKSREVQLYYVGATKNEKGVTELVVFAKGKEPILRVDLDKHATPLSQAFPIELQAEKSGEDQAKLHLGILGQFSATLPVVKAE